MRPKPIDITVVRSKAVLEIEWDDGHLGEYPLSGLRAACPCAECRGGHENMGHPGSPELLETPLKPGMSSEVQDMEIVGNYALQLTWKDGHTYGIYTWDYLRALSPGGED